MKKLYYYDENMTLEKLIGIRQEALRQCPNKKARLKYIRQIDSADERFFYGYKYQLEYLCKEYGYDINDWYAII